MQEEESRVHETGENTACTYVRSTVEAELAKKSPSGHTGCLSSAVRAVVNQDKTIILACSSLTEYVEAAQERVGTRMQVRYLDRIYHRDPAEMQEHIKTELERMPEGIDTVLVCMGFCGGSWHNVQSRCRLVIPRVDDCVSLLLQTKDEPVSNLKKPGHLYVRAKDPSTESFKAIFERMAKAYHVDDETAEQKHKEWMALYNTVSVMDTGINQCRRDEYAAIVKQDADWLGARMEYVEAGMHLLEKLFSGKWDNQFLVLEPGRAVRKEEMLI